MSRMLKIITVAILMVGLVVMFFDIQLSGLVREFELSIPKIDSGNEVKLTTRNHSLMRVEMWSKAAIGQYVWENVLRGSVDQHQEELQGMHYIEGSTQIEGVKFTFRSGASLKVASLLAFSVPNLILVLNWRNENKINYSIPWLKAIALNEKINNVGIIALGSERCSNAWFLEYLHAIGSKIRFLFIVYDWNQVDNKLIYQWFVAKKLYFFSLLTILSISGLLALPPTATFLLETYPR